QQKQIPSSSGGLRHSRHVDLVERSWDDLSPEQKAKVASEGKLHRDDCRFLGFDGNNEPHYGVANYLIHKLG
ncbi:MAG: hypothetical protein J0H67_07290, partial [Rhodospirillales bacterium]|nr:hypothetical protein [Rhodospirillales bacterium]